MVTALAVLGYRGEGIPRPHARMCTRTLYATLTASARAILLRFTGSKSECIIGNSRSFGSGRHFELIKIGD